MVNGGPIVQPVTRPRSRFAFFFVLLALSLFLSPRPSLADEQTLSVGYGLAALNDTRQVGHLWDNLYYDFGQLSYGYEKTVSGKFNVILEPYAVYVNRPVMGADFGLMLNGRYYFGSKNDRGFFLTGGGGGVYTTVKFTEQGTHTMFVLDGGLGYRWHRPFVDVRFRHYSNAGLSHPNRSIDAVVTSVGYAF
jgi:hypothetical protein